MSPNPDIRVQELSPRINPIIFIDQDLTFTGIGACNNYSGNFIYDDLNDRLVIESFMATLNLCDNETHDDFETAYFTFFEPTNILEYFVFHGSDEDLFLQFNLTPDIILYYQDFPLPLSTPENQLRNITITPNPVSSTLHLNTQNLAIQSLYVFNLSGQKILEQSTNTKSLDVSSLQNGMYFLQIATEKGSVIKKFIKQ